MASVSCGFFVPSQVTRRPGHPMARLKRGARGPCPSKFDEKRPAIATTLQRHPSQAFFSPTRSRDSAPQALPQDGISGLATGASKTSNQEARKAAISTKIITSIRRRMPPPRTAPPAASPTRGPSHHPLPKPSSICFS